MHSAVNGWAWACSRPSRLAIPFMLLRTRLELQGSARSRSRWANEMAARSPRTVPRLSSDFALRDR